MFHRFEVAFFATVDSSGAPGPNQVPLADRWPPSARRTRGPEEPGAAPPAKVPDVAGPKPGDL